MCTALVRFRGSDLAAIALRRLRAPQSRARQDPATALRIRKAVARAARIVPGTTCLSRTLAGALMLRRRGIVSQLHRSRQSPALTARSSRTRRSTPPTRFSWGHAAAPLPLPSLPGDRSNRALPLGWRDRSSSKLAPRRPGRCSSRPRAAWRPAGLVARGWRRAAVEGSIDDLMSLRRELASAGGCGPGPRCRRRLLPLGHRPGEPTPGDFAIALWDEHKHLLYLARDRFGATPLYTSRSPWGVAFSTSIASLLAICQKHRAPDEEQVVRYIARLPLDPGRTFYRQIRAVPPSHALVAERGRVRVTRYWRPIRIPSCTFTTTASMRPSTGSCSFVPSIAVRPVRTRSPFFSAAGWTPRRWRVRQRSHWAASSTPSQRSARRCPSVTRRGTPPRSSRLPMQRPGFADMADASLHPMPWEFAGQVEDPRVLGWYAVTWPGNRARGAARSQVNPDGCLGDVA